MRYGDNVLVTFDRANDTDARAHQVQLNLLRQATPAVRARRALQLSARTRWLAKEALRRRNPSLDEDELRWLLAESCYGEELVERVRAACRRHPR